MNQGVKGELMQEKGSKSGPKAEFPIGKSKENLHGSKEELTWVLDQSNWSFQGSKGVILLRGCIEPCSFFTTTRFQRRKR